MREYHYWIVSKDPDTGGYTLIYGDKDESMARRKGLEMLAGVTFELRRFPTRDLDTASAMFRGKRLEDGEGLHAAKQRLGHERTLKRMIQRRSRFSSIG
jgi:hypothetical protein